MKLKFVFWICTISLVTGQLNALKANGRIENGLDAYPDSDFVVRVLSSVDRFSTRADVSTGIAVTSRHVVTVAQAIHGYGFWRIGFGSIIVEDQKYVTSDFANYTRNFNPILLLNNIGVIRIDQDEDWEYRSIQFRALQLANLAYGYGFTNGNVLATELQRAVVFTQAIGICTDEFNGAVVNSDNFCTRSSSVFRNGDQGGPVIDPVNTDPVGLISFWGIQVESSQQNIVMVDFRQHIQFLVDNGAAEPVGQD